MRVQISNRGSYDSEELTLTVANQTNCASFTPIHVVFTREVHGTLGAHDFGFVSVHASNFSAREGIDSRIRS